MAVPAIDAVISDMMFVAELHGLVARNSLVGNIRRASHDKYASQGKTSQESNSQEAESRKKICTAIENLSHCLQLRMSRKNFRTGVFFENFSTLNPDSVCPGHPATA